MRREDGTPVPEDERPISLCLRTGAPVQGVIMGVGRADTTLTWLQLHDLQVSYVLGPSAVATGSTTTCQGRISQRVTSPLTT